MKGRRLIQRYGTFLLAFCLTACQVKRPKVVLPDAKMENVLYDYHIAKAMGEEVPYNESYKRVLYVESVFKKHGITQADFDTTMAWYARNPEVLAKVYEKVNQRLKVERDGINHLIALRDNKPDESLPGDSIDVWIWQHIYRLTGMPLNNRITFKLPSDTNFHDRDVLHWSVRFRFNGGMPDSIHAPLMAMQIQYEKNDTVIGASKRVSSAGIETIGLNADTLGKIKEVRGFIYYPMQPSLRSLVVDSISLMRYHATDSLAVAPKDTLGRADDSLPKQEKAKQPIEQKPMEIKEAVTPVAPRREGARPRPRLENPDKISPQPLQKR